MLFRDWLKLNESNEPLMGVHMTTPEFAMDILNNGFSLKNFGNTAKKSKQLQWLNIDPVGVYFIRNNESDSQFMPPHPFGTGKGVRIYAHIFLRNPLHIGGFVQDDTKEIINYKNYLLKIHKQPNGKELTKFLIQQGHDGIITDGEIVVFDPSKIVLDREKTVKEIQQFANWYTPKIYGKNFQVPEN